MGINPLLSYSSTLMIMFNSMLSATPTFYMGMFKFPVWAIEQIDSYRKHYLWDRGDINRRGGCLVAWIEGGLGILDLKAHNKALLLKHLNKFYNRVDFPWVQLTLSTFYIRPTAPQARSRIGSFCGEMSCPSSLFSLI